MKVLLFAHIPPPHHGQSYMVQQLLAELGGDARLKGPAPVKGGDFSCYHVNARLSRDAADIGRPRWGKLGRLLGYCAEAIRLHWRTGASCLIYVPAPAKFSAIVRDWLVMILCRPFFAHRIYWWQAAGLGEWLSGNAPRWQRWLTRQLLGEPALSLVLSDWGRRDAEELASRRIVVIPNGIPDPCPDFTTSLLPLRRARAIDRRAQGSAPSAPALAGAPSVAVFELLFLSLCTREKGLFDALEAVAILNRQLVADRLALRVRLTIAGSFPNHAEQAEVMERLKAPDLTDLMSGPMARYVGFVEGDAKTALLRASDGLCFPTYYAAEGFPVVLLEAMAAGLHVVTTRWRTLPAFFPSGFDGLVPPKSPPAIAEVVRRQLTQNPPETLRTHFLQNYTAETCFSRIKQELLLLKD